MAFTRAVMNRNEISVGAHCFRNLPSLVPVVTAFIPLSSQTQPLCLFFPDRVKGCTSFSDTSSWITNRRFCSTCFLLSLICLAVPLSLHIHTPIQPWLITPTAVLHRSYPSPLAWALHPNHQSLVTSRQMSLSSSLTAMLM